MIRRASCRSPGLAHGFEAFQNVIKIHRLCAGIDVGRASENLCDNPEGRQLRLLYLQQDGVRLLAHSAPVPAYLMQITRVGERNDFNRASTEISCGVRHLVQAPQGFIRICYPLPQGYTKLIFRLLQRSSQHLFLIG